MLTNEERRYLLTLARKALVSYFKGEPFTPPSPPLEYKNLYEKRGAFVTLTKKGRLRGCIGALEGDKPLYQLIPELALSSAFQDPRFPPLSAEELPEIKIEISILSPLYPGRPEEVEVGKHGIYIVRGFNRGVLLPQVATEYNLTREEFLRQGCLKAGLPEDCYKDPKTKLYLFTAEVFEED
jgi:AmmeMemoRadiSam system protein A